MATILPPKLVPEKILVRWDFSDELAFLEGIAGQKVVIEVESGLDPDPDDMLYGTATSLGSVVSQFIYKGIPGVIYRLTCTVEGAVESKLFQKQTFLAILPSNAQIPALFGIPYTSKPYPIESIDGAFVENQILDARLNVAPFPKDGAIVVSGALSGELRTILQNYPNYPPEGATVVGSALSGSLLTILINYPDYPPEGGTVIPSFLGGELKVILITYPHYKEAATVTGSVLSGVLT